MRRTYDTEFEFANSTPYHLLHNPASASGEIHHLKLRTVPFNFSTCRYLYMPYNSLQLTAAENQSQFLYTLTWLTVDRSTRPGQSVDQGLPQEGRPAGDEVLRRELPANTRERHSIRTNGVAGEHRGTTRCRYCTHCHCDRTLV